MKSFDETDGPFKKWGKRLVLQDRDDWAKYIYGDVFASLSSEKQEDRRRRHRPGKFLVRYKRVFESAISDECELADGYRASYRSLQFLILMLVGAAARLAVYQVQFKHLPPDNLITTFLELTVIAVTLPNAVILWGEPAPVHDARPELVPALPVSSHLRM